MNINQSFYRVRVEVENDSASHIVITYDMSDNQNIIGMQFYRTVFNTDDSEFSIPSGRQATFQEQLRVLNQATISEQSQRQGEQEIIKRKMKEAYGSTAKVQVEQIKE